MGSHHILSPYLKTTMKFFFVTLVIFIEFVTSQNCMFPDKVVELKNGITSSTPTGHVIEKLKILNLKSVSPSSSSTIQKLPCTSNSSEILKHVISVSVSNESELEIKLIANPTHIQSQLIDQLRIYSCELNFIIICTDDRTKVINLAVPLVDNNDKIPEFEINHYDLDVVLPWNFNVPINHNQAIIVKDLDRDFSNREIKVSITDIESEMPINVEIKETLEQQFELILYFVKGSDNPENVIWDPFPQIGSNIPFTLTSYNIANPNLNTSATINLRFIKADRELPQFKALFYSIEVNDNSIYNYKTKVEAMDPDNLTPIIYEIIHINPQKKRISPYAQISRTSGEITISNIPPPAYIKSLRNYIDVWEVTAKQLDNPSRNSTVPFLVYFIRSENSECEPTESPTTEYLELTTELPTTMLTTEISSPSTPTTMLTTEISFPSTPTGYTESDEPVFPTTPTSGFECSAPGEFPDPFLCNVFHTCVDDNQGGYTDYRQCCANANNGTFLIWCHENQECEDPAISNCTCESNRYDEDCFECEAPGKFTHTRYCNKYFNCILNPDNRTFTKERLCCEPDPDGGILVFCQHEQRCIAQNVADNDCTCIHENEFDYNCNPEFGCPTTEGNFSNWQEEEYCNVFQMCQDFGYGQFHSTRVCCQPGTNGTYLTYCEKENRCMTQEETEKKCKRETKCRNDLYQCNNEFECHKEGNHPDNYYCNVYHECKHIPYNDYIFEDTRKCCEYNAEKKLHKVFCESLGICLDPEELEKNDCSCLIPGETIPIDETCPGMPVTVTCKFEGEYIPDPLYCNKFYQCVNSGGGGFIPRPICCPEPSLVFCPTASICDHLENCHEHNPECQPLDTCQDELDSKFSSINFLYGNGTFSRQR